MKRKGLSKSTRFEVFKRDKFTCKYCGAKAPDVILEVDHIVPVAKGGKNNMLNLVTACKACNGGKSDKTLCDTVSIDASRAQAEAIQERLEQSRMMIEWHQSLLSQQDTEESELSEMFSRLTGGFTLSVSGKRGIRKVVDKYGLSEVLTAMKIACEQNLVFEKDNRCTQDSAVAAFKKIEGICKWRRMDAELPGAARATYVRGILRRRMSLGTQQSREALDTIIKALKEGADIASLEELAKTVETYPDFDELVWDFINGAPVVEIRRRD